MLVILIVIISFTGCYLNMIHEAKVESVRTKIIGFAKENPELMVTCVKEAQTLWQAHVGTEMSITLSDDGTLSASYWSAAARWKPNALDTEKTEIIEDSFALCEVLKTLDGSIYVTREGVDFRCGGLGFSVSSYYYGIFYSPTNDMTSMPYYDREMIFNDEGNGVCGRKNNSDNTLYIEDLNDSFFYYEASF